MCVIIQCQDKFPKLKDLKSAERLNSHGGSIAWVSDERVHWRKNLTAKQIHKLVKSGKVKTPAIIHFRIASIGSVTPELCHPFPIERMARTDLKGSAKRVLFHNGTWDYTEELLDIIKGRKVFLPSGEYSDSRLMAVLTAQFGDQFLSSISGWNKITILDAEKGIITREKDNYIEYKGNLYSNNYHLLNANTQDAYEWCNKCGCDTMFCNCELSIEEEDKSIYFKSEHDLKIYDKCVKAGKSHDEIMNYVYMGYEPEEIEQFVLNREWEKIDMTLR